MKIGIIADDYTGSADTGVQFAKRGLKTAIVRELQRIREAFSRVSVVVFDTESRRDPPERAYEKVASICLEFQERGTDLVYKKIDSTLRGNIGVELDAILDTMDVVAAVVCPAYPKTGRITVGGYHLVHQELIQNTEIADDAEFPVKNSHIPTLLRRQSKHPIASIEMDEILRGKQSLVRGLRQHIADGSRIIVIDAVSQRDLATLASAVAELGPKLIVCGSGGLAEELPEALNVHSKKVARTLVIAGSIRSITAQQIEQAQKQLQAQVIDINMKRILSQDNYEAIELNRIIHEATQAFAMRRDVIVRWADSQRSALELFELGHLRGLEDYGIRARIGKMLGDVARMILSAADINGLILTGGETASTVYKSLEVLEVSVEREVLPGIPLVRIVGGTFNGMPVITKAGAFGDSEALVQSIHFLGNL